MHQNPTIVEARDADPLAGEAPSKSEPTGVEVGRAESGPSIARARKAEPAAAKPPAEIGGYRVTLPSFEGPLDLLLHLIRKHELNILDIPIAFIAEKYVAYIMMMREFSIDIASEYLVMAATLAHIKSKMLLPASPDDESDEESSEPEEDPRTELVRRLLEYQKYKLAVDELAGRSVFGRDVFGRGTPVAEAQGEPPLAPLHLFLLLDSFQRILERTKRLEDHPIDFDRITITERISELSDVLRAKRQVLFEDLFTADKTIGDLILTFLALLEMTRLRLTELVQEGDLGQITVSLRVWEEGDVDGSRFGETDDEQYG